MNIQSLIQKIESIQGISKVMMGHPSMLESIENAPIVWLSSITESPMPNERISGPISQKVLVNIELTVGTRTHESMDEIRSRLLDSLLGFQADPDDFPMTKSRGKMEFMDPSWVVWVDYYDTAYYIEQNH